MSDIFRDDLPWYQGLPQKIGIYLLARTTEVGGRTLVHAVKSDIGSETHGKFLMDCKIAP